MFVCNMVFTGNRSYSFSHLVVICIMQNVDIDVNSFKYYKYCSVYESPR